jgi:hypothetical protein
MVDSPPSASLKAGWVYNEDDAARSAGSGIDARPVPAFPTAPRYRIWATERGSLVSVLIEESVYPLSAPVWGPDGHSLFYCRFIPDPAHTLGNSIRGRYELVLQQSVDQKRLIATVVDVDVDREQFVNLPELKAAWSPDGQFLAVPRPGPRPAVLIVLADKGRVLKTIEQASHPSWSPDGSRLAILRAARERSAERTVQVIGQDLGAARNLIELRDVSQAAVWSPDGQSILVAGRRPMGRTRELELIRVLADSGIPNRVLPLGSPALERQLGGGLMELGLEEGGEIPPPSVSVGFDREQDLCVHLTELPGQVPQLGFSNIRRPAPLKKFHPLDLTLRMGALAYHPDGQVVAVRVKTPGGCAPPLLCELGSESVRLIAPDGFTHREWLVTMVLAVRSIIQTTLPKPTLDGQSVARAWLLPIPGELGEQHPAAHRLRRIGKVGRALLDQPVPPSSADGADLPPESHEEYSLFFDFLRGDYAAAEGDLVALEAQAGSRDARLRLLGLRALILQAQGHQDRSQPIAAYLAKVQGAGPRRIEETPAGAVVAPTHDQGTLWSHYLVARLSEKPGSGASATTPSTEENGVATDLRFPNLFEGLDARGFDGFVRPPFPRRPRGFGGQPAGPGDGGFGGRPFGPDRPLRGFPPLPPRPFQPGSAPLPRFQRLDRAADARARLR